MFVYNYIIHCVAVRTLNYGKSPTLYISGGIASFRMCDHPRFLATNPHHTYKRVSTNSSNRSSPLLKTKTADGHN